MADTHISSDSLLAVAREFLEKVTGKLDPYTSTKGVIEVESDRVILLTPAHIQFAVYGRGPGKKPPLDPILDWVERKHVTFEGKDSFGTARALQAIIGQRGTLNWVPGSPNALEEAINENIEEYNRLLGDALSVTIDDELQKIYKEVFPDKQEIKY